MFKNLLELSRGFTLPLSIAPWLVAVAFALFAQPDLTDIILTFLVVLCLHVATNLLDDCVDIARERKKTQGDISKICFEIGKNKAKPVIEGKISYCQLKFLTFVFFAIPFVIGLYFTLLYGPFVPFLAVITLILCAFYPFATKHYMGEIVLGILFGPLLTFGTYFILTMNSPFEGTYYTLGYLSLSLALFTVSVMHTHSIMDFDYDIKNGKKTLATLFRTKPNAVYTLAVLLLLGYLNILYLISLGILPFTFVLVLITLPLAFKLVKSMNDYININDVKFLPKWCLGPMENWAQIVQDKKDYFMYRFYISRNLDLAFCIICATMALLTMQGGMNYVS